MSGTNSSFRNNASLWSLAITSNQFEKGVGTKKFLHFSFLRQDTICLKHYSPLALFPASRRATLKSFGDVFAKSCYQCRCKWDGTLGTASAGFEVIRQPWKHSILKGQRICCHKRKECWFKTQVVWGKFQHKVVLKSTNFAKMNSSPLLGQEDRRYDEESYCPEKTNNTFEKESWANNGEKSDMPQNLFNDDEICTTCEGSSQATQI